MSESIGQEGWVYVIVSEKDGEGTYLGLFDEEQEIDFIPAFTSREAAQDSFLNLPREPGKKYEIQAIHIEELTTDARQSGFKVSLIDSDGKVVDP
jgi:IMP cyclohydrolase